MGSVGAAIDGQGASETRFAGQPDFFASAIESVLVRSKASYPPAELKEGIARVVIQVIKGMSGCRKCPQSARVMLAVRTALDACAAVAKASGEE